MELSTRQQLLLEAIRQSQIERGYGPSIRELGDIADISSTSVVSYNLDILEREGLIERDRGIARGLRLVKPNGKPKAACSVCGQVGEVQAGPSGVMIVCPEHGVYFEFYIAASRQAA